MPLGLMGMLPVLGIGILVRVALSCIAAGEWGVDLSLSREVALLQTGDRDMWRAIIGALAGCVLVIFVGWIFQGLKYSLPSSFRQFWASYMPLIMASLSIIGAIVGGTGAILSQFDDIIEQTKPPAKPNDKQAPMQSEVGPG